MTTGQERSFKKRIERLKKENQVLREKFLALGQENRTLQKVLRDTHRLFNNIPAGVVVIQDGKIILANETTWEQMGCSKEEIIGRDFLDFVHPYYREYLKGLHQRRLSGKSVPNQYETHLINPEGKPFCYEIQVKKIRHERKRAFVVSLTPLDQKKQLEKQITQAHKAEVLARMAQGVGKEFDRCMRLLYELPRSQEDIVSLTENHIDELRKRAQVVAEKGGRIIGQLKNLAMCDRKMSDEEPFDLKQAVKDAVTETKSQWKDEVEARGIEINVKTYLRSLSPVRGRADEIKDVFVDMIRNAVAALPFGGEIYLTAEENSGFAHIYIQDSGVGIPEDIREKIFDPFFTTDDRNRAGLGLSLADAVVRRHGGEIELLRREGQGATFTIRLPLAPKASFSRASSPKNSIKNVRILLVTDDDIIRDLLGQLLTGKGGKVTAVSSGAEGLKSLKKRDFDLVIIDMHAYNVKSSGIVTRIKKSKPDLPVALIHYEEEEGNAHNLFKTMGADLLLGVPLDMDRILGLISRLHLKREA